MSAVGDKLRELAAVVDERDAAIGQELKVQSARITALAERVAKLEEVKPPVVPPPVVPPTLSALSANQPATLAKPSGWVKDPTYGCMVRPVTHIPPGSTLTMMRHPYSRHQAFNADKTLFLAQSNKMTWHLYSVETGAYVKQIPLAIGEVQWHPTDPKVLYLVNGLSVYRTNIDTFAAERIVTLPALNGATVASTKGEGSMDKDGRYWGFLLSKGDTACGLAVVDVLAGTVVSQLDASAWGGQMPDHCSISANGDRMVVAWDLAKVAPHGTRSYARDLKTFTTLHNDGTHSDLALGADGSDQYVYADYNGADAGWICTRNAAGGDPVRLVPIYQGLSSSYSAHISGKCFGMPGWVLVSTYLDKGRAKDGDPRVTPDPILRPQHKKLFLVELKAGGERKNVIHTRQLDSPEYWDEPQASISRDGKLAVFASRWLNADARSFSYVVELP